MKTGKNRPCFLHLLRCAISKRLNEKGRKINGGISDEGVQKETPLYRNSIDMGDVEDVVTSYPKKDIIKLG